MLGEGAWRNATMTRDLLCSVLILHISSLEAQKLDSIPITVDLPAIEVTHVALTTCLPVYFWKSLSLWCHGTGTADSEHINVMTSKGIKLLFSSGSCLVETACSELCRYTELEASIIEREGAILCGTQVSKGKLA